MLKALKVFKVLKALKVFKVLKALKVFKVLKALLWSAGCAGCSFTVTWEGSTPRTPKIDSADISNCWSDGESVDDSSNGYVSDATLTFIDDDTDDEGDSVDPYWTLAR